MKERQRRLISGRGEAAGALTDFKISGGHCSREDGEATDSGKAAEMEVKRRAAVDDKMELRNSNEGGSTAAARARGRKPADARGRRRREKERGPDRAGG